MMSLSLFDIRDTSKLIQDEIGAKYNMMRFLGTNDWSSVTYGIIEALLENQQANSLSYLRPQFPIYPSESMQKTKKVIKLLKLLDQLTQPHMTLKYFYDSLRIIHRRNTLLGNYIMDLIKQKFNCATSIQLDQISLKHFIPQFNVVLYLTVHDGTRLTINPQGSIPVVIYQTREGNYYCFQNKITTSTNSPIRPPTSSRYYCVKCFIQYDKSKVFINQQCKHAICEDCVLALTASIKMCQERTCTCIVDTIAFNDYRNSLRRQQNIVQQENQFRCIICAGKFTPSNVFKIDKCTHCICFDCIAKRSLQGMLIAHCPACSYNRIDQDQLEAFYIQRQTDMLASMERSQMQIHNQLINNQLNDHNPIEQIQGQMIEQKADQLQKIQFSRCPKCGELINKDNLKFALNHKNGYSIQFCCVTDEEIQQIIANQESQIIGQYKD